MYMQMIACGYICNCATDVGSVFYYCAIFFEFSYSHFMANRDVLVDLDID